MKLFLDPYESLALALVVFVNGISPIDVNAWRTILKLPHGHKISYNDMFKGYVFLDPVNIQPVREEVSAQPAHLPG